MYDIRLTNQAKKDAKLVEVAGYKNKAIEIIKTVCINPYDESQGFEMLKHDLKGAYSRRINRHHRFVYEVLPNDLNLKDNSGKLYDGIVKVLSMWTHYHKK
ncbi:MAG: Txe/YoeB family addiction module toxin [Clostridiales bacterium]|jgi:Txe/YoeB family toxin of toxin-antitoxin system|nr:Txe/YoeB family addiction module toxin [Clostridiales bacterium]